MSSSSFSIVGRVLTQRGVEAETSLTIDRGEIASVGGRALAARRLDARQFLVLPGIVDLHGDAFERPLIPRVTTKSVGDYADLLRGLMI